MLPDVGSSRCRPGSELARGLGRLDHRLRDAVLDRAGRVLALELAVDLDGRLGRDPRQLDERRVADEVEERRDDRQRARRRRATGHRRQQDHRLAGCDRGLEPVERADVLAAEIDVDERRDLAVAEDLRAERRVARDEVLEHGADRVAVGLDLTLAADLGAQRRGDPDGRHACTGRCHAGPRCRTRRSRCTR